MLLLLFACTEPDEVDPDTPEDTGPEQVGEAHDTEFVTGDGCDPGAAPVYVTEGQQATFVATCRNEPGDVRFYVSALPDGASFDEGSATFTWVPDLDDAGQHTIVVRSESADGTYDAGLVTIWVADAWDEPGNERVDPLTYDREFGLPVFHLEVPPATNDTDDVSTTLVYRKRPYALELKYRGAASSYYPKRSYTLSFPADDEFEDEAEGFEQRHKIVLTTLFDDNSYLRQLLCYELWSAADPTRHDIQTYLAVLYVNGDYEGLYLVSDHIDGEYWEDHGYDEDGSLYKSVTHEANFYATYNGGPKSSWHAGYEKQEGVADDWTDLDALVQFVANSDDATFAAEVEDWVDVDEIADWWILVHYTEADDSGGKNAYLYADATTGRFHHAPWDFNHSFGQTWQTEREASDTWNDFTGANNLFRRLLADPTYGPRIEARLRDQLATTYAADAILARIDAHLARVEPSAERDWEKWQAQYRAYGGWSWRSDWTDHDEEVAYLEEWVQERERVFAAWYP